MSQIYDESYINHPLFKALRQVHNLPVIDSGLAFASEKKGDHHVADIVYRDDPHWKKVAPESLSCRLQENFVYVQYMSKESGLVTLKADLRVEEYRIIPYTVVPAEEFPPCARRESLRDEEVFWSHDASGTKEWTWSWVESKEDNTKEKRREQLAAHILPEPIEGEKISREGIPHNFCLTNYRLCEVRDLDATVCQRLLTVQHQAKYPTDMQVCQGEIFSTCTLGCPTHLASGISLDTTLWLRNVIGIYSGSNGLNYALCYCFEGLRVVWFRLKTVNP